MHLYYSSLSNWFIKVIINGFTITVFIVLYCIVYWIEHLLLIDKVWNGQHYKVYKCQKKIIVNDNNVIYLIVYNYCILYSSYGLTSNWRLCDQICIHFCIISYSHSGKGIFVSCWNRRAVTGNMNFSNYTMINDISLMLDK